MIMLFMYSLQSILPVNKALIDNQYQYATWFIVLMCGISTNSQTLVHYLI